MNWKEEASEKLKKYNLMRTAVQNLPLEIRRLQEEVQSLRAVRPDLVVSGSASRRDDQMINNIVRRQALERALENAQLRVKMTDQALGSLTVEEKRILHRMYIQPVPESIEALCSQMQMEKSSIYRHREQALRKFTLALYGAECSS